MSATWRDHARPIIAQVLRETAGRPEKQVKKALREAYPFGVRDYHPYKIWCDEIKRQRGLKPSKPSTGGVIYGWLSGRGEQLYVYDGGSAWGVTKKAQEASHFPSVQACIDHYLSKRAFPENYRECTTNGYLKFIEAKSKQLILF